MSPRARWWAVAALLLAVLPARSAGAATPEEQVRAVELATQGHAARRAGRFADAIEAFAAAYALDPAAELVWLLADTEAAEGARLQAAGRIEAARTHLERAAQHFAGFQTHPRVPDDLQGKVAVAAERERRLRAAIGAIDAELARRAAEAADAREREEAARRAAAARAEQAAKVEVPAPPPDDLVLPGAIVAGAGVVIAGLGAGLLVDAEATRQDVRAAATDAEGVVTGMTQVRGQALERAANERADWGVVGLAVGAAVAVTGVALMLYDEPAEVRDGQITTTIGGTPLPGGGLLCARARF